ncbi:MAG TPA: nitroreductase family protein [Halanaerobiales bacterium]|nr:nitroreductase family protein [Halanaerobiales bacterium]
MSGIVFKKTKDLEQISNFYQNVIGMELWQDQDKCKIFEKGNLQLGFCEGDEIDNDGIITFYYNNKKEVDKLYNNGKLEVIEEPKENDKFNIYQFFAKDPEGRTLEFQTFLHNINPFLTGKELLLERRSYREYSEKEIPEEVINKVIDISRYAPTSMNSQSYYFKFIRDEELICDLASIRKTASEPIKKAPMAVAICSDNEQSNRYQQDADIAAYHFMLAARLYNLGTCWIADMDRESIKRKLDIPVDHYIATITPLGYIKDEKDAPSRKDPSKFIR